MTYGKEKLEVRRDQVETLEAFQDRLEGESRDIPKPMGRRNWKRSRIDQKDTLESFEERKMRHSRRDR